MELQKTAKTETDKLEKAKERLVRLQTDEEKELAKLNVQIQKQIQSNKDFAKSENESATALEKFNVKAKEQTNIAKNLGAEMALLEMEGKKNTKQYKELEKQFDDAAKTANVLNGRYREISKAAGDNRALVGSYSEELENHFSKLNDGLTGLKNSIASGDIVGGFNAARTVITGFGQAVKTGTEQTKGINDEVGKSGGVIGALNEKFRIGAKCTVDFFKPSEENAKTLTDGLERLKIGFTGNNEAVNKLKTSQSGANTVSEAANDNAKKGGILTNLFSRAQLGLSGATGIASGAFNILKIAIASTGIGLIVIIIALLINYMMKLDPIMDAIEQAFAGLGGVIDYLTEIVGSFFENIKSLGDLFSKLGDIIAHPIDSMKSLAKGMGEAAIAAADLKRRQQDLADQMDIASVKNKVQESEIARLMIQSKDRTLTEAQRQEAFLKAETLNDGIYQRNKKNAEESVKIAILEAMKKRQLNHQMIEDLMNLDIARANSLLNQGKITKEAYDMLKASFEQSIEVRNQYNEQLDKITTKKNNALDKADEKAEAAAKKELERQKKSAEIAIAAMKAALDYQIAIYDQTQHIEEDNLGHVEAISAMKVKIAEAEMKKNLIGIEKGSLDEIAIRKATAEELGKIEVEKNKAIRQIAVEGIKAEIELYDLKNKTLIEDGATITDLLIAQEKNRIDAEFRIHKQGLERIYDLEDDKVKQKVKNNQKLTEAEQQYYKAIRSLEDKSNSDTKKADKILLDSKLKAIDLEEKTETRKFRLLQRGALANSVIELKNEEKALKAKRKLYKEDSNEVKEIDLQLAENKQKMDALVENNKKATLDRTLNLIMTAAGQESEIGKAIGFAMVTMDTIEQASKAFAIGHKLAANPATAALAPNAFLQGALIIAEGGVKASQIAGISLFAEGTDYAPYTGKAIAHELGPELHFDKYGNLKSMGSDKGPELIDIVQGDKIVPADISAIIRQTMFKSYGMNDRQIPSFDYNEIGKQFGKHTDMLGKKLSKVIEDNATRNIIIPRDMRKRATFKGRNQ